MMNHRWRVYLQLFTDGGEYSGEWVEITEDVDFDKMSAIQNDLDNTEYDIGVYRSNYINLILRNDHGRYSDLNGLNSIFRYKRSGTLVKITWELTNELNYCGINYVDDMYTSEELVIFTGLLNDEATEQSIQEQNVSFKVLSRDSIFQKVVVPFDDLSDGDLISDVIFACLNQEEITRVLTVDAGNISVDTDLEIDAVASLENKTVQEALAELLLCSNSVIYIDRNGAIVVSPRTASADVEMTFYGQTSGLGSENIQDVSKLKSGIARTFNFFTWASSSTFSEDDTSRTRYGTRKKEISTDLFTDVGKRTTILNALRDEFGNPKREFDLITFWNYQTELLNILDKVTIDYPPVYLQNVQDTLPICGTAICGDEETATLPRTLWDFVLTTETEFKILGRSIDPRTGLVKFKLREI